jgi:hypothetical protein
MKIVKIATLLVLGSAGSLLVGCGQKEQAAPATTAPAEKTSAIPATEMAKPADMPAPALAPDQAQGLIDKVKSLIAEKKYTEALAAIKDLSALTLTAEQQTMVDGLKAQIEQGMRDKAASDASKSVDGLLGK